jgi:DNA mismatch repair protein MutL
MLDVIQLLPDAIANQIAAGEVVQRPASVVKELLENAVDAQATDVQLIIKDSGKALIQVVDNGQGMTETDARMCLERHATSKIRKSEDLFSIRTMGFRGEAMASIAAVAQVEIRTKTADQELGSMIVVEASEVKDQQLVAAEKGTSVCVKNLFYNVPARRNFLKSNAVEMRHIMDEFQRVSLANPLIRFTLHQNNQETYNLPTGKLGQRIVNLFGKNHQEQMASCEEHTDHLKVKGYIGKPESAKKTRGEQFFFVNNRFIKSNYLNHAVTNAYEGLIVKGSYPFYVLFIEIDPARIDVNVHPTKTEIKFDDERTVYAIVRAAVKKALGTHNISPSIDFDFDTNFNKPVPINVGKSPGISSKDSDYTQFRSTPQQKSNLEKWETMYDGLEKSALHYDAEPNAQQTVTIESAANNLDEDRAIELPIKLSEASKIIFQLHRQYLVTQVKSGMLLVDQQAAHERILFEQYNEYIDHHSGASQQCLFPQNVELSPADYALILDMKEEIQALGFIFEIFGKQSIVINGIPADVLTGNEKVLFEGLIEQFKYNQSTLSISNRENLARSLAKRSAVKYGKRLEQEEMHTMIDKLFACKSPNYAPDGRPTYSILSMDQLAGHFK